MDGLINQVIKDATDGKTTSVADLAKMISAAVPKYGDKLDHRVLKDLESAVGLLVVEAKSSCKHGHDPMKTKSVKDAVALVQDLSAQVSSKKP